MTPDAFRELMQQGQSCLADPTLGGGGKFFDQALAQQPDNIDAIRYRALAYEKEVDCKQGIAFCRKMLETLPEDEELLIVLANLLGESGQSREGLAYAEQARNIAPGNVRALVCLAFLQDKSSDPVAALQTIESAPVYMQDDVNLKLQKSLTLRNLGRSSESASILQSILQQYPGLTSARSNFLLFIHDIPGLPPADIFRAHREYQRHLPPTPTMTPQPIRPQIQSGTEPPVIGFVSSDFREHSVAYFLRPLLMELNRRNIPICLFDNNPVHDKMSVLLHGLVQSVDMIRGLSAKRAAEMIRKRNVDILFDLGGHTQGNRLDVFIQRPAPVQVTWLGYPDTTGLDCIDYRLVDSVTDPQPQAEQFCSEKLIRLDPPFLCYSAPDSAPDVCEAPFINHGFMTFGSFNNFAKTSPWLLQQWAEILKTVPHSRLALKSGAFTTGNAQDNLRQSFRTMGVDPQRLILHTRTASTTEHLDLYAEVDIALDTFPYNGTTTTCEALYMGVPVLTLCGESHCSRVGASILTSCTLEPLIACNPEDYVQRAMALSSQTEDLIRLRQTNRQRLINSPLMDREHFTNSFLEACGQMLRAQ